MTATAVITIKSTATDSMIMIIYLLNDGHLSV